MKISKENFSSEGESLAVSRGFGTEETNWNARNTLSLDPRVVLLIERPPKV